MPRIALSVVEFLCVALGSKLPGYQQCPANLAAVIMLTGELVAVAAKLN